MTQINKCSWEYIFSRLVQMKNQLKLFYELLRWHSLILIRYRANLKAMKLKYPFPCFYSCCIYQYSPLFAEHVDFHARQTLLLFAISWCHSSYISHERPINVLLTIVFYVQLLLLQRFSVSKNLGCFPPPTFSLDKNLAWG